MQCHCNTDLSSIPSIHSSMNSLKTVNEYFTKPTSVGNKPGYIRTAATMYVVLLESYASCCLVYLKIFGRPGSVLGLYVLVPTCSAHLTYKHVMHVLSLAVQCISLPSYGNVKTCVKCLYTKYNITKLVEQSVKYLMTT